MKTSSYDYLLKELKKIGENSQLSFVHPNVTGDVSSFMYVVRDGDGSQPRSGADTPVDNDPYIEQLLGHLCGQLSHFIIARIKVMELYPCILSSYSTLLYQLHVLTYHKGALIKGEASFALGIVKEIFN